MSADVMTSVYHQVHTPELTLQWRAWVKLLIQNALDQVSIFIDPSWPAAKWNPRAGHGHVTRFERASHDTTAILYAHPAA